MNRVVRIKWSNHKGSLLASFDEFLRKESLVDVTLSCEGQFLRAHKMVLSACSPYFEEILSIDSSKHPIIYLRDTQFLELKALIAYMYRGEVNIAEDKLQSLILLAQSLKIRGLAQLETNCAYSPRTDSPSPADPKTEATSHSNSEPETINLDDDNGTEEENSSGLRISSISSGFDAAAEEAVGLLPVAPTGKSTCQSVTRTDQKWKATPIARLDVRNSYPPQPGLHYHTVNLEEDSESGFGMTDNEENGEIPNEDGGYYDPMEAIICDFQDEEGEDSIANSNLSSGEWGSEDEGEEIADDGDCDDDDDTELMPYSPTVGLDTVEETMDPYRLGVLREMKIISNRKGRKTVCARFRCPNPGCGRFYSQKSSLKRHLDFECYKAPQFSCPHCGLKSKLRRNSQMHARRCKFRPLGSQMSMANSSIKK